MDVAIYNFEFDCKQKDYLILNFIISILFLGSVHAGCIFRYTFGSIKPVAFLGINKRAKLFSKICFESFLNRMEMKHFHTKQQYYEIELCRNFKVASFTWSILGIISTSINIMF